MRQVRITRNASKTARSEPQSDADARQAADSRAEHDKRSAALLARLDGRG